MRINHIRLLASFFDLQPLSFNKFQAIRLMSKSSDVHKNCSDFDTCSFSCFRMSVKSICTGDSFLSL